MTMTNDTVTAKPDAIFKAVSRAWDELVIPACTRDMETCDYLDLLKQTILDLAARANEHESVAQHLAEANVRQSQIISKLRAEITNLRVKVKDLSLASERA